MNRKWLGAVMPLTMLLASCADMPTETTSVASLAVPSGLNFYAAPVGDVVIYGTGQDDRGGELWAINLTQGTTHLMWTETDPNPGDRNSPNAVAFDAVNGRMYFTVNRTVTAPFPFTVDDLYMFNVNSYAAPVNVGTVARTAYSADFSNGSYYYVPNRTHDLMRVDFDAAGFKTGEVAVCSSFRAGLTDASELFFGDIAIRDGIVYGSVRVGGLGTGPAKFFRLTLSNCAYTESAAGDHPELLQLAWGGDGVLYGHDASTGLFHVVDPITGTLSAGPTYAGNIRLSDVAPASFTPIVIVGCPVDNIPGVTFGTLSDYLFVFTDARSDANWQSSSKGYVGNVAVDGLQARLRTSGSFAYAGTIFTNAATLPAWQTIVDNNSPPKINLAQAFATYNETTRLAKLETDLKAAMVSINGLTVTPGFESRSSTSLAGDYSARPETLFVINVTSGFGVSSKINITGRADQVFILRWDTDANPANGYQGQVKFQSGGAIVPLGGLTPANFVHTAGDINASGGGSNPAAPYPQGPRLDNGQGALITCSSDFSGGGFFTGYWLTTGKPATLDPATGLYFGDSSSMSNAIFVGGWYSINTKFSMTSGTSGVHVVCP
jgi:hypothetical protein